MIARHEIGIRRRTASGEDEFGNPVEGWGAVETVKVYSIGPTYTGSAERERLVVTGYVIGSPSDYGLSPADLVVIDGEEWQVVGELLNANRGPWDYSPGYVITVKRAEQ